MLTVGIRNVNNGNTHSFEHLEDWDVAEDLFKRATDRGLAACIFQEWGGYDSFWDGRYMAQNKRHKEFEDSYCSI
jgi:hypothetical protein